MQKLIDFTINYFTTILNLSGEIIMPRNIPTPAQSPQSVYKNINELDQVLSENTELRKELKSSYSQAKGIYVHYSNGKLLFGLARMVGFEDMSAEKYIDFRENPKNKLVFRQHADLSEWFDSITRKNAVYEVILDEYEKWLKAKFNLDLSQTKRQEQEFLITKDDLEAFQGTPRNQNSRNLTRESVEEIIDEYCQIGQKEFYEKHLCGSSKYWFTSPIKRENYSLFPTSAIVSVAVKSKRKDGLIYGWIGGKFATCILLHNLGYLITDKNGKPITELRVIDGPRRGEFDKVPDEINHLLRGEEWIQAVAENYYVLPAIDSDLNQFSIDPKTLHKDIGSYRNVEDIYNALNDPSFHEKLGIKRVNNNDENESESQILHFEITNSIPKTTNLIYYGPPGTGKTYKSIPKAVELCGRSAEFSELPENRDIVMKEYQDLVQNKQIEFVTFHQSFSYEEFVEGLRPTTDNINESSSNQSGGFELITRDGIFKTMCKRAEKESSKNFVLIIDEINRANISKVFGELITLLEPDKRLGTKNEIRVVLPYSGDKFGIPPNLHIIGTMNTADRSIALLDTALRRRFKFEELMPILSEIPESVEGLNLRELVSKINQRIETLYDREHQIGHAKFLGCKTISAVDDTFRNYVIPLLAEYFFEDRAKIAEVLEDQPIGENGFKGCFLSASILNPPNSIAESESENKLRWEVNESFNYELLSDFSNDSATDIE